jgi:hypothetical protein
VISPHPLDRLVEQDRFAEMLALLEPEELVIASLRLEELSDDQIASLLDIDRTTVRYRMEQARQRIVEALPELASVLRDRRYAPARDARPLQRGWLCASIGGGPDSLASRPLGRDRQASGPRLPGRIEERELSSDSSLVFAVPE